MMTLREILPRDLTAWCFACNGLTRTRTETQRRAVGYFRVIDGAREEHKLVEKDCTISYCMACGSEVDTKAVPVQLIDRLRLAAAMVHGEGKP